MSIKSEMFAVDAAMREIASNQKALEEAKSKLSSQEIKQVDDAIELAKNSLNSKNETSDAVFDFLFKRAEDEIEKSLKSSNPSLGKSYWKNDTVRRQVHVAFQEHLKNFMIKL